MTLKNVELRKLPAAALYNIANILETNNDWKKVMSFIPRNPRSEYFEPKYNNEHIKQIEDHARASNRKCADILFDEWGTSGRIRPTLKTLKDVVQKAKIYRAADEIAQMLEEEPPRRPHDGPEALIDTNITLMMYKEQALYGKRYNKGMQTGNCTTLQMKDASDLIRFSSSCSDIPNITALQSIGEKSTAAMKSEGNLLDSVNIPNLSEILSDKPSIHGYGSSYRHSAGNKPTHQISFPNIEITSNFSGIDTDILKDAKLIHFEYQELEMITKRFSDRLIYTPHPVQGRLAGKIGSGGFGDVYVGYHPRHGHLAVKMARLHPTYERKPEIPLRVFNSEVKFLSQFRHKNIVPILGFSKDGPSLCIVCEYIDGGSVEQKLAAKILTEKQRIDIMIGTAEGLKYLHTSGKLDRSTGQLMKVSDSDSKKNNFVHGDVKTANILLTRDYVPKLCDFGLAKQYEKTCITTCPMGTSAYMAPEGFSGTITQKIDIYSYGIVLLELLTGLKPLVVNNDRDTINIKDFVEESCPNNEITHILDPFTDKWTKAHEILNLAKSCLVKDRKSRPSSEEICDILYELNNSDNEPVEKDT